MDHDNVFKLAAPGVVDDPLTEILRSGARKLLEQAVHAEVEAFLEQYAHLRDGQGRSRVVRNGFLPEREVQTGVGAVEVKVPRVRDRTGDDGKRIRFSSSVLPKYLRRSKSVEELIPWLYLKGVSTGDFQDALVALLGRDAPGLSPSTISRLKLMWRDEFAAWEKRDLSAERYAYLWVDGVYFHARMEESRHCALDCHRRHRRRQERALSAL